MTAPVMWLGLATAFASMAVVFVAKTFADTVFLAAFGVQYVPHFYVALAIVLIGGSALYGTLIRRGVIIALDLALLALLVAVCAVSPALIERGGAWVFAVAVAMYALPTIASLALWNAATDAVTGRRARSFLPKAGAAATLGGMLGGFGSSAVLSVAHVRTLSLFAGVIAAAALMMRVTLARHRAASVATAGPRPRRRRKRRAVKGAARKLVTLLAAAAIVEALIGDVLDFGFKQAATERFDANELGMFFSLFYGGSSALILLLQLFATSRVLATRALRLTLGIAPIALLAVGAIWIVLPGIVLATAGRSAESVLKFGVSRPGQEIALTPLSSLERQRWKVLLRGVFNKVGGVVAGLLLLALAPLLAGEPTLIPILIVGFAAVLLFLQRGAANAYLAGLGSALGLRRLNMTDQRAAVRMDREGVGRVVSLIGDSNPQLARFGREILARSDADASDLTKHLGDDARVRRTLYELAERKPNRAATAALERAVTAEPTDDDKPLRAGLRALAAHGSTAGVSAARTLVDGTTPRSADDAALDGWAYLAAVGALDDEASDELERVLHAMLGRDGARAAKLYAAAIERGRIAATEADNAIANAILHGEGQRKREALAAAAALGRFTPLSKLLGALGAGAPGAEEAFAHLDASALFRIVGLVTSREAPPVTRSRLLRALRMCELPEVSDVATTFLTDDDAEVREVAARVLLKHSRERGADVPRSTVEKALSMELDLFGVYAAARTGFSAEGARESMMVVDDRRTEVADATRHTLFDDEVERRTERELGRVCGLLALLARPETVYAAARALRSDEFKQRRQAIDVLQEVVRGTQRTRLMQLLELYLLPPSRRKPEALEAVCDADPWLARCADGDFDDVVARLAALRSTSLFADVDSESLVELAAAATEERYSNDEIIVREGEPGDALYVVIEGSLRVFVGEKRVGRLGVGEAFGELALLDGRPRTATVQTRVGTRLLKLPRSSFRTGLNDHPSIGLGLVRGLTRLLRSQGNIGLSSSTTVMRPIGTLQPRG